MAVKQSIKRVYSSFRGVDFTNDPAIVNLMRSPDAVNVWKNYADTQGNCIEQRPGYQLLGIFGAYIYGLYMYKNKAIVHAGTTLYLWNNFPSVPSTEDKIILKSNMNETRTSFSIFNDKLYILDGLNYLVYDGNELKDVTADNPYVPTTTIARSPSGGGEKYEDVNLLTPKRKNSFVADGTSTVYQLDAVLITSVISVKVDGEIVTNYSVNTTLGRVTFTSAPSAPVLGNDNVVIEFEKSVGDIYSRRIPKCKKMLSFDRRLFFTGNPDFPNALFHSQLNTPNYISDLAYYQDGSGENAIKSMSVGNNVLWIFKETNQQNETVFYHVPEIDSETGKIYPSYQGNISTGCYADSINYRDDIVFISRTGLEGVSGGNIQSKQLLNHRSSLIDAKFINENNLNFAMMTVWQGYLLILVNSALYLADMRQMYSGTDGYEYEWFYWKYPNDNICYIKEFEGNLYLGAEDGSIFIVQGSNDNDTEIHSYWTTPMDNFGYENHLKTTNKRGGIVKIKTIPNGRIQISEKTNKDIAVKDIKEFATTGFNYAEWNYANFAYTTTASSNVVYKIKEKKFIELSLKFSSKGLNKPFGIYSATIEAFIGGYVKR